MAGPEKLRCTDHTSNGNLDFYPSFLVKIQIRSAIFRFHNNNSHRDFTFFIFSTHSGAPREICYFDLNFIQITMKTEIFLLL